MPRVVLLGTGTDVGKTYVATALARALHDRFPLAPILPLKPIETGYRSPQSQPPPGTDAAALEQAAFNAPRARPHPLHAFPDPVSPHLAAARASEVLSAEPILDWIRDAESHLPRTTSHVTPWTLVETAGGVFSPLSTDLTNLALARALEPAHWVLVAPDSLGVIHDLTATVLAMRHTARLPDAVVLTQARPPDSSTGTNADELHKLSVTHVAATFARNDPGAAHALVARLCAT